MLPETTTATATTASAGATCSAKVNGVATEVQLARDLTVAVGDVLLVHRVAERYYGCCRLFGAAVTDEGDDDDLPDLNVGVLTGRTVVMPVSTGTYRDASWLDSTQDTLQGQFGGYGNATGVAYYGDKPATLAGATVLAASVRLVRSWTGGAASAAATTLWLVTETEQPAGAPTLTSSTAGPALPFGDEQAWPVPTAWAQAMVDGTAGGLAVFEADGAPYARLNGRGTDPAAWMLVVDWQR